MKVKGRVVMNCYPSAPDLEFYSRPVVLRKITTTATTMIIPRTSQRAAVPESHPLVLALNIAEIAGGRMYPAKMAPMKSAIIAPTTSRELAN